MAIKKRSFSVAAVNPWNVPLTPKKLQIQGEHPGLKWK
ncbi:hypothetical protein EcSMS35_4084 [Escherichia coli SMS-3-5]|uniref:Uncharacterized protein n=1 Tax=Escherichia coli (strain SMS-3-5 / SECEC) TaxID=439855 RepID=B1LL43_ECOSM|nr:hypothetical protein EcSMS35_4084 [Escherichia coli SMS-3-5]AEQ15060.1 hypothetical protein CE10_4361 [Escherichia coli O7:K1 str. CE10]